MKVYRVVSRVDSLYCYSLGSIYCGPHIVDWYQANVYGRLVETTMVRSRCPVYTTTGPNEPDNIWEHDAHLLTTYYGRPTVWRYLDPFVEGHEACYEFLGVYRG